MIALGGKLKREYYSNYTKSIVQDYLIDIDKSLKENEKIYEPMISTSSL